MSTHSVGPARLAYLVLALISLARVVTWCATGFGDSPHVGFLQYLPTSLVAVLWAIGGVTTAVGGWHYRARQIGITLTAIMNASVGTASFFNRTVGEANGITMSVAVSYLGIAVIAVLLPRLTDAGIVLDGERGKRGCQ